MNHGHILNSRHRSDYRCRMAVNTTSVTFANPVVGETYCVEVTATGLSGRTASSKLGVPVPARPVVISIQ